MQYIAPGMGLGVGAYAGHTITDLMGLRGPPATAVQATFGVSMAGTVLAV